MTATAAPITLVIADDHPLVLQGLRSLIAPEPDLEILACCQHGEEALMAIAELEPAIAVLDFNMPRLNGMDILAALNANRLDSRVVFLSAVMVDEQIHSAVSNGAYGIVLKDSAPQTLLQCLRYVASGHRWFPREIVDLALGREFKRRQDGHRLASLLTVRERQIVALVARELSNKEIARLLKLSEGTVKIHLHNVYQKLGVAKRSTVASIATAYQSYLGGNRDVVEATERLRSGTFRSGPVD